MTSASAKVPKYHDPLFIVKNVSTSTLPAPVDKIGAVPSVYLAFVNVAVLLPPAPWVKMTVTGLLLSEAGGLVNVNVTLLDKVTVNKFDRDKSVKGS